MLMNSPAGVPYQTVEFTLSKRPSRNWDAMVSALVTKFDDPGRQILQSPNEVLLFPTDNRDWNWSYKAHASYRTVRQIQLGLAYVGQRSLPTARTYQFRSADPDGELLTYVDRFDVMWQVTYPYANPPVFPAGTVLHQTSWHDNSASNKRNPDPTNWVGSGNRTIDEMSIGHVDFIYMSDEEYAQELPAQQSRQTQQP